MFSEVLSKESVRSIVRKLGKLFCFEQLSNDNDDWVILFHGFGADANDLAPLGEAIPTGKKNFNWLFPNGLLEVPIGPGWTGRAWWPIKMEEYQRAALSGVPIDLSRLTPDGLDKAFLAAMDMIKELKVPWDKVILGGFSQGAMLATEIYLRAPETPKGLVILSGNLLHADQIRPLVEKRRGRRFFMSHGRQDQVLPIQGAQRLETLLTQGGMKGSLQSFNGGHEIPMAVLQNLGEYLKIL